MTILSIWRVQRVAPHPASVGRGVFFSQGVSDGDIQINDRRG